MFVPGGRHLQRSEEKSRWPAARVRFDSIQWARGRAVKVFDSAQARLAGRDTHACSLACVPRLRVRQGFVRRGEIECFLAVGVGAPIYMQFLPGRLPLSTAVPRHLPLTPIHRYVRQVVQLRTPLLSAQSSKKLKNVETVVLGCAPPSDP